MKKIIPCVAITLSLILAGSFLPVLGVVGLMLCPLPLSILGCLEGHKTASIAELLIEATLFLILSPYMAVYFLIGCAPLSGVVFLLSRHDLKETKKYSAPESLLICAGTSIAFKLILLVVFWLFTGKNILFPNAAQMNEVLRQLYGESPEVVEAVRRVLAVFPYMMPALLVIYSSVEAYLNYSLCHAITKKYFPSCKNFPPELPPFMMWRFPVSLLFVSVLSVLLRYAVNADEWFEGAMFIINLQIIINIFMFIEGLALAFWIMAGFKFRRASKVFVCVLLSIPFFWPWLIVMGMCDMVFNMREKIKFGA